MSTKTEPYRGTIERRNELQATKRRLEKLIPNTIDPIAVGKLRADYREVNEELSLYYNDIPEGKQS